MMTLSGNIASGKKIRKIQRPSCSFCGTRRGMIRKYNLNICRRCFKEVALKMGFQKYS